MFPHGSERRLSSLRHSSRPPIDAGTQVLSMSSMRYEAKKKSKSPCAVFGRRRISKSIQSGPGVYRNSTERFQSRVCSASTVKMTVSRSSMVRACARHGAQKMPSLRPAFLSHSGINNAWRGTSGSRSYPGVYGGLGSPL